MALPDQTAGTRLDPTSATPQYAIAHHLTSPTDPHENRLYLFEGSIFLVACFYRGLRLILMGVVRRSLTHPLYQIFAEVQKQRSRQH